jgi:hypothetical protein
MSMGLVVWVSKTPVDRITHLGLKTQVRDWDGHWGDTWHHHEACVEVMQSYEELVAARCTHMHLDYFTPCVK